MRYWFQDIDSLLRGGFTGNEELAEGRLRVPASKLAVLGLLMGAVYGVFMGLYGVLRPEHASVAQLLATMVKVPLLFLLTLVVTFPSLYVFSALAGSRLRFPDTLKLLLAAVAVNLALLASLGPVTGFFTLSTTSYAFMVVLNVLIFALAGLVAVAFLLRMLNVVFAPAPRERPPEPAETKTSTEPGQLRAQRASPPARPHLRIFVVWSMIYGVIGAQMGWILRPFIGTPEQPFTLFRQRESNFFEAFFEALGRLLV